MKYNTDANCNWLLRKKETEISGKNDISYDILRNFGNEISIKAKEIDSVNSNSKNSIKKDIDLQNLPLYFPQQLNAKKISASLNHTQNTQRWIGYVISKTDKKFTAKLEDITNPGTFEIGIFDIKDDASDEKEMIQIGAVFYLSVGYDVSRGTNAKQKLIRFQRLSEWTESDFDIALDRADRIASNLQWD